MRNSFIILCFILSCVVFGWDRARAEVDSFIEQEIMYSIANNDHTRALALLNTAINDNQEDLFALGLRSQVFLQIGEISKSLDDMDTILDKDITANGMLLYRCVVKESQVQNVSDAIGCYAAAAQLMKQNYSQDILVQDEDYLKLLILADSPNAEEARKEHMAYRQANGAGEHELLYIKEFERSKIRPLIDAILAAQSNNRHN